MPKVELIYFTDCPNVHETREQLLRAFTESGLQPRWEEWDSSSPHSPAYAQNYGSPTILVNGCDVENSTQGDGANCCRIYQDKSGQIRGVPSVESIISALSRNKENLPMDLFRNSWPKRKSDTGSCSLCAPPGPISSNNKGAQITLERS